MCGLASVFSVVTKQAKTLGQGQHNFNHVNEKKTVSPNKRQTDGLMNEWINGWTDKQMDKPPNIHRL